MAINFTLGLFLVLAAVVLLVVAGLLVAFATTNTKAYFELLAFGSACGFLGVKIP